MTSEIPFRPLNRPLPDIEVKNYNDGSWRLKSRTPLGSWEKNIAIYFRRAARDFPDRPYLVRCAPSDNWATLPYSTLLAEADRISSYLLERGYGPDKGVMILSGNSFAHATLKLAAVQVGIPVTAVSPSFSLLGSDFSKLRYAIELTTPGLIFAEDGDAFSAALAALDLGGIEVVTITGEAHGGIRYQDLLGETDRARVDAAFDAVDGDTLAMVLFTSGSTGMPKAVPNTHSMLCAAQKTLALINEPVDAVNDPARILCWLPWHHTFGGTVNFFTIARQCGTIYMDDGKPVPGLFDRTIENLKRVQPTRFSSVPAAFAVLAERMEQDEELARKFFASVRLCQYGGAALPQEVFQRFQHLSIRYTGMRTAFGTGWGSTETSATGTAVHWNTDRVGLIGLPTPGIEVKVLPVGEKLEIRVKGPNVLKEYYKRPDLTAQYFDAEGYYCIGDAVRWIDPENPAAGMIFDGRVAEDFKLLNGTWVNTGALRVVLIGALDPVARDIVIAGHDRDEIGILIVPTDAVQKRVMAGEGGISADGKRIIEPALMETVQEKLASYNRDNGTLSRRVGRALVLAEPLSVDRNEITDKQYINQGAVLDNRADLVDALYDARPLEGILTL